MSLSNKTYDFLKWFVMLVLPAIATFYATLAPLWNWPLPDEIVKTITALCALLGSVLGLSTLNYNRGEHEYVC